MRHWTVFALSALFLGIGPFYISAQSFKKTYRNCVKATEKIDAERGFSSFLAHPKHAPVALYYTVQSAIKRDKSLRNCLYAQGLLLRADSLLRLKSAKRQRVALRRYEVDTTKIQEQLATTHRWAIADARVRGTFGALDTLRLGIRKASDPIKSDIDETHRIVVNSHLETRDYEEMRRIFKDLSIWIDPENYRQSRILHQRLWTTFKTQFGGCALDRYARDFPNSHIARDCWREEIRALFCKQDLGAMLDFYATSPHSILEVLLLTEITEADRFDAKRVATLDSTQLSALQDVRLRNSLVNRFRGKTPVRDSAQMLIGAKDYVRRYAPRYSAFQMIDDALDYFIEQEQYSDALSLIDVAIPAFPDTLPAFCRTTFPFQHHAKPYLRGKQKILQKDGIRVKKSPFEALNTPEGNEFAPVMEADGQTIYFAASGRRDNMDGSDVFVAHKENGAWGNPKLVENLSGKGQQVPCSVTVDGKQMLILLNGKLCLSKKQNKEWTKPTPLNMQGLPVIGRGVFTADGRSILMEGSYTAGSLTQGPDMDIFVSTLDATGQWSTPAGLGSDINTDAQESNAFLSSDGQTLYYCSEGYPGLGEGDVFVSTRLKSDWVHWSPPVNLSKTVNDTRAHSGFGAVHAGQALYTKTVEGKGDIWILEFKQEE